MTRSTLFFLALISAFVFHTSPACASLGEFLYTLKVDYGLDEDAALKAKLADSHAVLQKHNVEVFSVDQILQTEEGRKAVLAICAAYLEAAAAKEPRSEISSFFTQVVAFIRAGSFEAALKDPAQLPVLQEYLKTRGKSKPPSAFASGTVQTAEITRGFLVSCFAVSLVLTQ